MKVVNWFKNLSIKGKVALIAGLVVVVIVAASSSSKKNDDKVAAGTVKSTTSTTASGSATTATTKAPATTTTKPPTTTTTAAPTTTTTQAPTTTTAAGPKKEFGSGTFVVGKDIAAGTYRAADPSGCYWARLSGFGGSLSDIIANTNTSNPEVVTIAPSDKGFESNDCGTWKPVGGPITSSRTSFGPGTYIVGTDIAPGTYRNSNSSGCYWARLHGFGGTLSDIIANDNTDSPATVTIAATDKGFQSNDCGDWSKIA